MKEAHRAVSSGKSCAGSQQWDIIPTVAYVSADSEGFTVSSLHSTLAGLNLPPGSLNDSIFLLFIYLFF